MNRYDCEVIFLNQEGLPKSPETNMLLQMQGMFAEYEREKILERTRRGRRHAANQGSVSVFGRAPFGYRYLSQTATHGEARWEIDPVESEVVQNLFKLVAHEGYSLAALCRELQRQEIRTRTGNLTWCTATIRGMLRNPAYCGEARYGKKRLSPRKSVRRAKRGDPAVPRQAKVAVETNGAEQIMIPVPALVSKSLFEEVGKQMDENRNASVRITLARSIFSAVYLSAVSAARLTVKTEALAIIVIVALARTVSIGRPNNLRQHINQRRRA